MLNVREIWRFLHRLADQALLVTTAVGTAISIIVSGYVFAIGNNLFHLPIVARIFDEPQFKNDAFVQSLRHFYAGPWMLMEGVEKYLDPYWLFFFLFVSSRIISIAGLLLCASHLGVRSFQQKLLFALIVSVTFTLRGSSYAGGGGLFINYFTHSELANGFFLFSLWAVVDHRLILAGALAGVVFLINAFMGVWAVAIVGAVILYKAVRGGEPSANIQRGAIASCAAFLLIASPVLMPLIQNSRTIGVTSFNYQDYLMEYFPGHFLFSMIDRHSKIALTLLAVSGLGAFIASRAPHYVIALSASCLVYAAGILAPHATDSHYVLSLHLLRVSTFIHLLTALGCAALATILWFETDWWKTFIAAPLLILLLSSTVDQRFQTVILLLLAVLMLSAATLSILGSAGTRGVFLLSWTARKFDRMTRSFNLPVHVSSWQAGSIPMLGAIFKLSALIWLALAIATLARSNHADNHNLAAWSREWREVGYWARIHTDVNSVFLKPLGIPWYMAHAWRGPEVIQADMATADSASAIFEMASHRSIWVDWKRGAAVMWSQSFYSTWKQRMKEQEAILTVEERHVYARTMGIHFVIEITDRGCSADAAFSTKRLCVYASK
jgi:hypothetical protein